MKRFQKFLDEVTPHTVHRWLASAFLLALFMFRIFLVQGFYIVTYVSVLFFYHLEDDFELLRLLY